jgi:hypothetical protein
MSRILTGWEGKTGTADKGNEMIKSKRGVSFSLFSSFNYHLGDNIGSIVAECGENSKRINTLTEKVT